MKWYDNKDIKKRSKKMAFEQSYDVSSQEFGHNDLIRPSAIWRYMQESASRQMLAEGPSY